MIKNILLILYVMQLQTNFNLQNNNHESINLMEKNISGVFKDREYEYISINNKLTFLVYEKSDSIDLDYDPTLHSINMKLIRSSMEPYIVQIQYVKPHFFNVEIKKKLRKEKFQYNNQDWHEIELTFSNGEKKIYLISSKMKIIMVDKVLKIQNTIDFSKLVGEGLVITGCNNKEEKI